MAPSSKKKKQPFGLTNKSQSKRPAEGSSRPVLSPSYSTNKRFKTTGEEPAFENVRTLTHYGDKMQTNDEIHRSIEVCPVMKALIDTEAFQRLRNIRQLGTSEWLYTCANGNRFQHSLGVAHLAERMCKRIKDEQPSLEATDKDVLCVKLAGLLHDIGHGPYSHLYESFRDELPQYLKSHPHLKEEYNDCEDLVVPEDWSHEQSSLEMIDAALSELGLQINLDQLDSPLEQIGNGIDAKSLKVFKHHGTNDDILTSRDFVFVKECILGKSLREVEEKLHTKGFIGRDERTKEWMYDIVNNRHSGLDVDKIDYFARDSERALGPGSGSIDNKMIEDARVAKVFCGSECHYRICYPLKHVSAVMNFFKKRLYLHTIVYQHKKTVAVSSMMKDIFFLADPFFRMVSDAGERYPISRAILRSDFLLPVDDNVLRDIARSKMPELKPAQDLYRRLRKHDMYKCAVDQTLDIIECEQERKIWSMSGYEIKKAMLAEKKCWKSDDDNDDELVDEDFTVEKYYLHHGKKERNPLAGMYFFDEMNEKLIGLDINDLPTAKQADESNYASIIPQCFQKAGVRIYCCDESKRATTNQVWLQWFERISQGLAADGEDDDGEVEMTSDMASSPRRTLQLRPDSDDDDDDADDDNGSASGAVMLSQDSDDEDDQSRAQCHAMDQSPIPVRSRG